MVGFDAKNKDNVDQQLICPVCSLILRDPVQLNACGHRQCQSCLEDGIENIRTCPVCQMPTQRTQIMLDRCFRNNMLSVPVDCSSCQWSGILSNYQDHRDQSHPHLKCEYCDRRFKSVSEPLQNLSEEQSKVPISVEGSCSFLQGVKHNRDIRDQELASLREEIDDIQYVSYDGTLLWKITKFRGKINDAESERQTSIDSPPFYSSPTGYEMRARLYLHGDDNTYMSLYFLLRRGPNDAILEFPFTYKVIFCMYDQSGAERHIIDFFRASFQRPQSEISAVIGISRFFSLTAIQQEGNPYVRDDTMFIKVMVDFDDMPEMLLSYALSLNPGLPIHVRREIIERETRRKKQNDSRR